MEQPCWAARNNEKTSVPPPIDGRTVDVAGHAECDRMACSTAGCLETPGESRPIGNVAAPDVRNVIFDTNKKVAFPTVPRGTSHA
jgi:hypothetical protein